MKANPAVAASFPAFWLIFSVLSLAVISCKKNDQQHDRAGVAISFDDHFIDEWYALRPLFLKYQAKATFYITCPDSLTNDEIQKLKQLEKDGHEIGFHGTVHAKSTELIANGTDAYIQAELAPGLKYMEAAGFRPTSYAHPGGNHNDRVDSVLFAKGFEILRDVGISRRKFRGFPLYTLAPKWMRWVYYTFDGDKTVDALLIDTDSGIPFEEMQDALQRASDDNSVLMIFGHEPLKAAPINGEYGFDINLLERVLKEASRKKLKYYTMTELVRSN